MARGPGAARNAGWRHATIDLVAFLDTDVVADPGWLEEILPLFDSPTVAAVAPRVRSLPGTGAVARYEFDRSALDLGPHPALVRPLGRVSYVPTAALVVRRTALSSVGGFDEDLRFGEDVDLVWRIIDAGHTVRYHPAATVWHRPRPTVHSWARQRYNYGTSAAPLARRHPRRLAPLRIRVGGTQLIRTLRAKGVATGLAVAIALHRHLATMAMVASAIRRAWWPLALVTRRGRRILLAALLPCILDASQAGRGGRWLLLRVADDLAYGAGVWAGCLSNHTIRPLLPQLPPRTTGRPRSVGVPDAVNVPLAESGDRRSES